MRAPDFWRTDNGIARLLEPAGLIYAAVTARRIARTVPYKAAKPVICVGNLTAGGTGKTPVATFIAARLKDQGRTPGILLRGYGGSLKGPVKVDAHSHTADEVGDEALLHARICPTWIGGERARTAPLAIQAGADVLVMDDGHQHPGLAKDLSLVVVNGRLGFGNGRIIPAGPLREDPARALTRADAVLIMGDDMASVADRIISLAPRGLPILTARLEPDETGAKLAAKRVFAFAGIARPEKFFASLRASGCEVAGTRVFPDHHQFRTSDLAALRIAARDAGAILVTTEKDYVRLSAEEAAAIQVLAVRAAWRDEDSVAALLAPLEAKAGHGRV